MEALSPVKKGGIAAKNGTCGEDEESENTTRQRESEISAWAWGFRSILVQNTTEQRAIERPSPYPLAPDQKKESRVRGFP